MALSYKQKFNLKHGQPKDKSNSLSQIAKLSGFSLKGLKVVYRKGQAAFKTNPASVRPGMAQNQWGMARVYAVVDKSSKAYQIDKVHF